MSKRRKSRSVTLPLAPPIRGLRPPDKQGPATVSFRHAAIGGEYCLSACNADQLRSVANTLRVMTTLSWQEIYRSARKGVGKSGLAWTPYHDRAIRRPRPDTIPAEVKLAGIRVSEKFRILGYRLEDTFYVIWFDPSHKLVDG